MLRSLRVTFLFALAFMPAGCAMAAPPAISYSRDITAILRTACLGCHNNETPAGKFSVASYTAIMKGGKSGPSIVPGKSAQSRLFKLVSGAARPIMPPGGGLRPVDIENIRGWIDAGAKLDLATPTTPMPRPAATPAAPAVSPNPIGKSLSVASPVACLAYSPDGTTLAVGSYREVLLFDTKSLRITGIWGGQADEVRSLAYSRSGATLAAGGGAPGITGEIRLYDVKAGKETAAFGDHTDVVNGVAFSPDEKRIASGSADKSVRIWDIAAHKQLALMRDHADMVLGMAWSPDGKYAASCGADLNIKIWDPTAGRRVYSFQAHDAAVNSIAFSPDGKTLLSSSSDHSVRFWNFGAESSGMARTLSGHGQYVLAAAFSKDGSLAATASADKAVKLWKTADGANTITLTDAKDWVYAVAFSPDGTHVAAGCWDGSILIWNVKTAKLESTLSTLHRP
jgi:WD40 repeat protein